MNRAEQAQQAELFRDKHRGPRLLLLPNAWDGMSARIFVAAGFDAIATTSGGVAWSLGYADGEQAPWKEVVAATARIVRVARVPVTADIEAGYGETPDAVMRSVSEIIEAGAVGISRTGQLAARFRSAASRMPSIGSTLRARPPRRLPYRL